MVNNKNFIYISIGVIVLIIIIVLVILLTKKKTPVGDKYSVENEFGKFNLTKSPDILTVDASFKNLDNISAIHIHSDNGNSKPIIAWLCTSTEWENGTLQNTPGSNYPGCSSNNKLCSLNSPNGTPNIKDIQNKTKTYTFTNNGFCDKSIFDTNKFILAVHGKNFQKINNGCLEKDKTPGIDAIKLSNFIKN